MAHDIWRDSNNVDHMFVVGTRKDAWHELGQRCDSAQTWAQAMDLAGLNWKVLKQQLWAVNPLTGKTVGGHIKGCTQDENCKCQLIDSYAIFRDTDGAFLGTVGEQFAVKQNVECFQFVDDLLQASGGAHYDSAGALGNGATIWVSARIPAADINIMGVDQQTTYLVFMTAHDGSMAHTAYISVVRPVCRNTLRAGMNSNLGLVRIKHTKNQNQRFLDAKRQMEGVVIDTKALQAKLELLAKRRIRKESVVTILDRLFPAPEDPKASTTKRDNLAAMVLKLFESNDNNAIPSIRGTAYNMLNAVTEYADHYRPVRITGSRAGYTEARARAENAVVGTGEDMKTRALAVIEEVTADDPVYDPKVFGAMPAMTNDELARLYGAGPDDLPQIA